jgi:hypothetical protein
MLVRALKMLGYFRNETTSMDIDTAALDQPGDEAALMAERSRIGNDEPWNRVARQIIRRHYWLAGNQGGKTTMLARPIAFFADFTVSRTFRWLLAAAVLATAAAPGAADAARPGLFDGTWNVTFTPQAGNCHATNTIPFAVAGPRVSSAGNGKVTGGVSRNGSVAVKIQVGASWANGNGRLAGNSGAGRWSGIITGDQCSGIWQATRT